MKAEVKDQWVKDLRSGEFEQGSNYLRRLALGEGEKDQFCCLGVLCEQAIKAGVIPAPELHGGQYYYLDDEFNEGKVTGEAFRQASSLPRKVAEWAGIKDDDEGSKYLGWDVTVMPPDSEGDAVTAIGANDGMSLTFAQIADLIEQNVPAE